MRQILSAFETFGFEGFNLWDRATRLEYWAVMPVIWALILWALVIDAREIWTYLLQREIPPLNPLFYESFVLFFLTLIPRFALTVRRLHDSGRSGKWATLPVTAVFSGITLTVGLGATMLTSSTINGNSAALEAVSIGLIFAALIAGSVDSFWEALFATAAAVNAIGWQAIWAAVSDLVSATPAVDVNATAGRIGQGLQQDPYVSGASLLAIIATVATPFVAAFMHLFFMLRPSDRDSNAYGDSSVAPVTGFKKGPTSHNPMEGYAHLFEKTPEEEAMLKEQQKAELKALYRQRVLGEPAPVQRTAS